MRRRRQQEREIERLSMAGTFPPASGPASGQYFGPNLIVAGTWSMSVNGGTGTATESPNGQLNLTGDATNAATGDQSFTTVATKEYRLNFTVATNTAVVAVGTTQGGAEIASPTGTAGAKSSTFVATGTTTWLRFSRTPASLSTITAISVVRILP